MDLIYLGIRIKAEVVTDARKAFEDVATSGASVSPAPKAQQQREAR